MLYLAVDPGGTTGYAYINDAQLDLLPLVGQLPPQEFCFWADDVIRGWGADVTVICEKFTIGPRTLRASKGGSYDALDVIGMLRYTSKRFTGRDLEQYQPDEVMDLFTDKWLKERGWYVPGKGHANDAQRHLAMALAKRRLIKVKV